MKLSNNANWLSAKNCKDGDVITFLDEGVWKDSTRFTYDDGNPVRQLIFKVSHENEEKQVTLIKASRMAMIEAFGDDTIAWVNQKAVIALALNTQGSKSIVLTPIVSENSKVSEDQSVNQSEPEETEIPF